jgi:hypothetical protein
MKYHGLALILSTVLLAACGPKMEGDIAMTRMVTITNTDASAFTIRKIVANDRANDGDCVDRPGKTLQPGETYTTTFIVCGSVASVSVETDRGTTALN